MAHVPRVYVFCCIDEYFTCAMKAFGAAKVRIVDVYGWEVWCRRNDPRPTGAPLYMNMVTLIPTTDTRLCLTAVMVRSFYRSKQSDAGDLYQWRVFLFLLALCLQYNYHSHECSYLTIVGTGCRICVGGIGTRNQIRLQFLP